MKYLSEFEKLELVQLINDMLKDKGIPYTASYSHDKYTFLYSTYVQFHDASGYIVEHLPDVLRRATTLQKLWHDDGWVISIHGNKLQFFRSEHLK